MSDRSIAIIGDSPESMILSALLAEAGVRNSLISSYDSPSGQSVLGDAAGQASWLVNAHSNGGAVEKRHSIGQLDTAGHSLLILTDHASTSIEQAMIERRVRSLGSTMRQGQILLYTGLCPPSFTQTAIKVALKKHGGLKAGESFGLCYMPLLWNGESLERFRETPKVLAGEGPRELEAVQETLFSIFSALSIAPSFEAAETAGLLGPAYREVVRALELELAEMCASRSVDYSVVAKLCSKSGTPILGSPRTANGRDPIANGILLDVLGNRNHPMLMRTVRRINDEAPQRVFMMVKGALARCGRGVRRSKIAIVGLDSLGVDSSSGIGESEVIRTLVRRGASVSVYARSGEPWLGRKSEREALRVRFEPDLTRVIQKAQCAIIGLKPSEREALDLNPQKLAAEMDRPAAICDLSRVLEASNVERAGLFYTSLGRGCTSS